MSFKKIIFTLLYIVSAVALWLYFSSQYTADTTITNQSQIAFDFRVENEPVTVTAGSCDGDFIWLNLDTNDILTNQPPTEGELGSDCEDHYEVTKELKPGYWQNLEGSAEFKIENNKSITQVVPKFEVISVYVFLFLIFGVFAVLIYFALTTSKNK